MLFSAGGGETEFVSAAKTPALKAEQTKTIRKFRSSLAFIASRASLTRQPVYVKHVAG
jgi:hypothetical protein